MIDKDNIIIRNIYYMLAYAFNSLEQTGLVDVDAEEFENIHNLFAAILGLGLEQQRKRGLSREYLDRTEDLTTMRGRIDIHGSIHHKIARRRVLSCEFDELTENNLLNRILKTTANLLIHCDDVKDKYGDVLKREMMFFSDVNEISPRAIPWSGVRFHRNNQTYRMLIGICRLVIEGMLLTEESGRHKLASYMNDKEMSSLYESFVREYYKREHPWLNAAVTYPQWVKGYDAKSDTIPPERQDVGLLPSMKTDITLTDRRNNRVLIIDTKYYGKILKGQYSKQSVDSHNIYQIFTYVKNCEAELAPDPHTVSGMLLYARTIEETSPDISVNLSGYRIEVRTLDLSLEFAQIRAQLDGIVADFFGAPGDSD